MTLGNLLYGARWWWGIPVFVPEPVLAEAEEHWFRDLQEEVTRFRNSALQVQRKAGRISCKTSIKHTPLEKLRSQFQRRGRRRRGAKADSELCGGMHQKDCTKAEIRLSIVVSDTIPGKTLPEGRELVETDVPNWKELRFNIQGRSMDSELVKLRPSGVACLAAIEGARLRRSRIAQDNKRFLPPSATDTRHYLPCGRRR